MILARMNQNQIIDLITQKKYKIPRLNDKIYKPLDFLYTNESFKNKFSKNNTFIVDDNPLQIAVNQKNSIFIHPWCRYDKKDNKLFLLLDILKKNKNAKNISEIKYINKDLYDSKHNNLNSYECRFSESNDYLAKEYNKDKKIKSKKSNK